MASLCLPKASFWASSVGNSTYASPLGLPSGVSVRAMDPRSSGTPLKNSSCTAQLSFEPAVFTRFTHPDEFQTSLQQEQEH